MRSLLERVKGLDQNQAIQAPRVYIHTCRNEESYETCLVCQLFGTPAPERERWFCQTRLRFSDLRLTAESEQQLRLADTELPYTEVKSEAAIDRMTSAAVPRTMERVPAGAEFGPGRIAIFRYEGDDTGSYLDEVVSGMELLEADYLGGAGSRGSGRVQFNSVVVSRKRFQDSVLPDEWESFGQPFANMGAIRAAARDLRTWVRE
jgi:CRISPR-associated protein Csm3